MLCKILSPPTGAASPRIALVPPVYSHLCSRAPSGNKRQPDERSQLLHPTHVAGCVFGAWPPIQLGLEAWIASHFGQALTPPRRGVERASATFALCWLVGHLG